MDKNKFIIYTTEGKLEELVFYERFYNVVDISCKNEIVVSSQNPNYKNRFSMSDVENAKKFNM